MVTDEQKAVAARLEKGESISPHIAKILFGWPPCFMKKLYPIAAQKYAEFCLSYKHCQFCGSYFLKSDKKCANPECNKLHYEFHQNRIKKKKQTSREKYGNENFNNRELYKETCLKIFGVENPFASETIKTKIKETSLKKYGTESPNQSPVVKKKAAETNLKKYGTEHPFASEIVKNKIKETCLKKYGAEHHLQNPEIMQKQRDTNLKKYGYEVQAQRKIKNFDKYYDKDFWISNFSKIKKGIYYFDFDKLTNFFGVADTSLHGVLRKWGLNYVRKTNRTRKQQSIFDAIKTQNKIFNDRKIIAPKEVDIYLPDVKLAIEYDGLMFHSQGSQNHEMFPNIGPNEHLKKTQECAEKGIQLFHIFENENIEIWLSMIHNKLGINSKIYARKCIIKELKNSDTKSFQNENHIQGFCAANICIGLFHNSELVSIMTFGAPRFNRKYEYELIRFCTLKNHNVVGGASKLWKYFLKKYNPKSVISYANLRFSQGGIYEKLGFTKIAQSNPNYFYFKLEDGILESRHKYQKHKLADLHYSGVLENFDPTKSEPENMFNNGYRRIFDCGNLTYGWNME